jgi:hypothetical protein
MSDTPRTDEKCWNDWDEDVVDADFARQLERENMELRADAERYRWLRSAKFLDLAACWVFDQNKIDPINTPEEFDAAIDAAKAEAK